MTTELHKRTWCYVQRPKDYGISGCDCGNLDPDFSEYEHMLWCPVCQKDFTPANNGIFDGPVLVNACRLLGIDFRRYNLETGEVEGPPV